MNRFLGCSFYIIVFALYFSVLTGCQQPTIPLQFELNTVGLEPDSLSSQQRETIRSTVRSIYGTPNHPQVLPELSLDYSEIALASGPTLEENEVVLTNEGEVYAGKVVSESAGTMVFNDIEQGTVNLSSAGSKRFRQAGLYRQHCVHCHGVDGDGHGPTAAYLNPYPRDFRDGKFKFISTTFKPTTADLKKTLLDGIPGTSMPSFALLPEAEVDALVEYVKYLSWRGETEKTLINLAQEGVEISSTKENLQKVLSTQKEIQQLDKRLVELEDKFDTLEDDFEDPDELEAAEERLDDEIEMVENRMDEAADALAELEGTPAKLVADVLSTWALAEKAVVKIGPRPAMSLEESIAKGRELYFSKDTKCAGCHGIDGLGDGLDVKHYDFWNKPKTDATTHLYELPKQELKPRNLRAGVYRGGRRPVDIYTRLAAGINPSEMPQYQTLSSDQLWHLVDFVLHLPYEGHSHPERITSLSKPRL